MPPAVRELARVEVAVPLTGSPLKPDLVIFDQANKSAVIVDIACPFDNGSDALEVKRAEKRDKYEPLADLLRVRGYRVVVDALVVGALGSWASSNDPVLQMLDIPRARRNRLKRRCVSDCIRWSRDLYVEHVSVPRHRQYTADVQLEVL